MITNKAALLKLCNPLKTLTHWTGRCKLVCDGIRSFQFHLQREGCPLSPFFALGFIQQQRSFQMGSARFPSISCIVKSWRTASSISSLSIIIKMHLRMTDRKILSSASHWCLDWGWRMNSVASPDSPHLLSVIPMQLLWVLVPFTMAELWCLGLTVLYRRTKEWFGLEGILNISQFQPPCHGQGHLPLDQVVQS